MQYALQELLAPLGDDSPSGPNLEYDPAFQALERAAAGKAERVIGDAVKAAEEPDWPSVASQAVELFSRTRDLRVAMHLLAAWTRTGGLQGWAAGLGLIHGLLDNFWPDVHPQPDADDNDNPTIRINSIAPLGNIQGTLRFFRTTNFVHSQRLGRFSLRDLRIAKGILKLPPATGDELTPPPPPPSIQTIEGACMDCPEQQLADSVVAISLALDHAKGIDRIFNDRLGTLGPDLKNLLSDISDLKKFLEPQLAKRRPTGAAVADDNNRIEDGLINVPTATSGRGAASGDGAIASAQDVIRRIDEICDYYSRAEPSSPVPLLLRRAQRLVGKDFMDLLKDLVPSGIAQLQVISGPIPDDVTSAGGASDTFID